MRPPKPPKPLMGDLQDKTDDEAPPTSDLIAPAPAAALAATLDRPAPPRPGDPLPPLWHWLYFWQIARQSELGRDGHPRAAALQPEPGLPRRMAAGGRFVFHHPLRIGETAVRRSRVIARTSKSGRSGRLAFVVVEHAFDAGERRAITEFQDIVYREAATEGTPAPAPEPTPAPVDPHWRRTVTPDETLLYRYSALTFNGHRIHYDRRYAQTVEAYPDLVVHGPLIATLLLELLHSARPDAIVADYAYKAVRPTFLGHPFALCGRLDPDGRNVELWAQDHEGWLTISAHARLA